MKKIIAICLVIIMSAVLFTGCVQAPPSQSDPIEIKNMDSEYGLTKMCEDLLEKDYLPESGEVMASDVIGAEVGYRFNAKVNNDTIVIELYEFDDKETNDVAQKTIDDIEENGYFNVLGYTDVPAELSDSKEYVVVYNDDKAKGDEPDEAHKKQYDEFMKIFNAAE